MAHRTKFPAQLRHLPATKNNLFGCAIFPVCILSERCYKTNLPDLFWPHPLFLTFFFIPNTSHMASIRLQFFCCSHRRIQRGISTSKWLQHLPPSPLSEMIKYFHAISYFVSYLKVVQASIMLLHSSKSFFKTFFTMSLLTIIFFMYHSN